MAAEKEFPKIALVEPILENMTRVLVRDMPVILTEMNGDTPKNAPCGYLTLPQIFQDRPKVPTAPAIHMLWFDSDFIHQTSLVEQEWRLGIEVVLFTDDTNCGAIELMRYLTAITRIILRAQKHDLWATEPGEAGIHYNVQVTGWDSPDAFEAYGNKLVKRGRVLLKVSTSEKTAMSRFSAR